MTTPVFLYHGGRAGLDERGGGGPAAGLEDLDQSGLSHDQLMIGVPAKNTGLLPSGLSSGRNYIDDLAQRGQIIRTKVNDHDPGLGDVNLGRIIRQYRDKFRPGEWLGSWLADIQEPCQGYACNIEYHVLEFPITAEDESLARRWGQSLADQAHVLFFRCFQLAIITRLMKHIGSFAFQRFPVIVYCGYGPGMAAEYGCDWGLLTRRLQLDGFFLPPIDYAHCAYFREPELPPDLVGWVRRFPVKILHNIQLPPPLDAATTPDILRAYYVRWARQAIDRQRLLRPGDGFGSCDADLRRNLADPVVNAWDQADRAVLEIIAKVVKDEQLIIPTSVVPASWGQIKDSVLHGGVR